MYKHFDKTDAAIGLYDSEAERATFENGVLTFYFPTDGFWVLPDHTANPAGEPVRTDASEVRFHLLYEEEEDFHCYVFDKKSERKAVRKRWTVSELISALNSGKYDWISRTGTRADIRNLYLGVNSVRRRNRIAGSASCG